MVCFSTGCFPARSQLTRRKDLLVEGSIDLDPQYQRGMLHAVLQKTSHILTIEDVDVVWSETKQAALIDSMLRNYYIPPVIFG